ncbi:dopamine receptor 2-like isoform X2 [Stylophora pistillata]|nr:dopamine receptor 2-like isoform X2 [Stylophora pistillata]
MGYQVLIPWAVAFSVVAFVVLIGNILVIVSFAKKTILRTHTNYFIVSLAATDTFVGLISIPWWIIILFISYKEQAWFTYLHDIWVIFDILGGIGSILHLVALSWDRFCAIVWPLSHRIYTGRRYLLILALIWSVAIPVAVCSKPGMASAPKAYNVTVIVAFFFVPLVIICVSQAFVVISIRKNRIQKFYKLRRSLYKEVRVAKTVIMMIALFMIGWLPFFALSLVTYIRPEVQPSWQAICAVKFLQYGNSVVNPVLYAHKFPHFRKAFSALLCPFREVTQKMRNVGESFRATLYSLTPESNRNKTFHRYLAERRPADNEASSSNIDSSKQNSSNDTAPIGEPSLEEIELRESQPNIFP